MNHVSYWFPVTETRLLYILIGTELVNLFPIENPEYS